ncbi:MAG: right-handed parallel beta-helix repeat-containing protein [Opitutaceae bacterium]|nr:right-handed parallel beta-helix repeat-containing protein [Opitutaceae bacterium]
MLPLPVYPITAFGAVAGVTVNSAAAIQRAVDAAHADGGGTVIVPAGLTFMCGSFSLKSRVRLHLEPGSRLLASADITDYINYQHLPLFARSDFCRFWIFTHNADEVTIDGTGTLDANSPAYVTERRPENTVARNPRAQSVMFLGCRDVVVRGIRIINTPSWALRPSGCDRVLIEGITILNDLGLVNSDGIDIDCSRSVRVVNCHIEAGDDAISIKGRQEIAAEYGPCEDIVVTGCVLESHCVAFRLGCESHVDFRRIVFTDSIIRRSHRGIGIDCRDAAVIEDVLIANIVVETIHSHRVWWHEGEPIWICQVPYVGKTAGETPAPVARLRNIVFRDILITSEQGVYVQGARGEAPPRDILFENVRIHLAKHTAHPVGFFDPRPNAPGHEPAGHRGVEEATPWGSLFRHDVPGFFIDRAEDVTLRNCRVTWADHMPSAYSHALEAWNAPGLKLENFQGTAARPGIEAVSIHT